MNRGIIFEELERYSEAIHDLNRTIELNPNFSKAYNNRGIIFTKFKKYESALLNFEKAIELNPEDVKSHNRGENF